MRMRTPQETRLKYTIGFSDSIERCLNVKEHHLSISNNVNLVISVREIRLPYEERCVE
jgi:hypothetical protein